MTIRHTAAFFTAALVFGSVSTVVAAGNGSKFGAAAEAASSGESDAAAQTSRPSRQAPIGHCQPRADDVPANVQRSPSEFEQRRMDQELDGRLIICRGC
jgi:hypothetical protein